MKSKNKKKQKNQKKHKLHNTNKGYRITVNEKSLTVIFISLKLNSDNVYIAPSTILTKLSDLRLAPPTNAPSISD